LGFDATQVRQLFAFCGNVVECALVGADSQFALVEYATAAVRLLWLPCACMLHAMCIFEKPPAACAQACNCAIVQIPLHAAWITVSG
jgi:hypothetical protein